MAWDNYLFALQHGSVSLLDGWLWKGISNYQQWPDLTMTHIPIPLSNYQVMEVMPETLQSYDLVYADSPIQFHFLFVIGFYVYSIISMFSGLEPRQSDYYQMLCHHFITLGLVCFSWKFDLFRIGALILILHDISDPFMELAKINLYLGKQIWADFWFGVFTIVFLVSRWIYYPFYIVFPTIQYTYSPEGIEKSSQVPFSNLAIMGLIGLLILHIYWGYLILCMVVRVLKSKKVGDDIRDE